MAKQSIADLEEILREVTEGLKKVTSKKMFGCHALWVDGNVFALVWKHGRIGVKLPDRGEYENLLKTPGAEPWKAGPMQMSHWVLIPESFHTKQIELKKWISKAYELCSKLEKKLSRAIMKKSSGKEKTKRKMK